MMPLMMPQETKGSRKLPICTIRSTVPYSASLSTEVYSGIRKKTSTLELKVPMAKIRVFDISFQYLFKIKTLPLMALAAPPGGVPLRLFLLYHLLCKKGMAAEAKNLEKK